MGRPESLPEGSPVRRCPRCGRLDALGWSPAGPVCPRCARELFRAHIQLASIANTPAATPRLLPPWAVRLLVTIALLGAGYLLYLAR